MERAPTRDETAHMRLRKKLAEKKQQPSVAPPSAGEHKQYIDWTLWMFAEIDKLPSNE
jgi:hypothetical protein